MQPRETASSGAKSANKERSNAKRHDFVTNSLRSARSLLPDTLMQPATRLTPNIISSPISLRASRQSPLSIRSLPDETGDGKNPERLSRVASGRTTYCPPSRSAKSPRQKSHSTSASCKGRASAALMARRTVALRDRTDLGPFRLAS